MEFYGKLADILDVAEVHPTDVLSDFVEWDSLSVLSVIAMAGSDYGITLHASDLWKVSTVQELHELVTQRDGK